MTRRLTVALQRARSGFHELCWRTSHASLRVSLTSFLFGKTTGIRLEFPLLSPQDHLRELAATFDLEVASK